MCLTRKYEYHGASRASPASRHLAKSPAVRRHPAVAVHRATMALEADLAKMSERVCSHMNHDHADSLLAWAHFYAKVPDAASATMTDVKPDGFELELTKADGYVMPKVLIPFDPPLEKAGDVRKVAVAMHFAAFNGLGWQYKLANGFYTGAARQAWHHMPPRVKSGIVGAFAVVCAAVMRVLLR